VFLRVGHFEGEGVGTAFVYFDNFNIIFTISFSVVFEKLLPRELDRAFKSKKSLCIISLMLYGSPDPPPPQ
jgi:hypothetical protein